VAPRWRLRAARCGRWRALAAASPATAPAAQMGAEDAVDHMDVFQQPDTRPRGAGQHGAALGPAVALRYADARA